MPEDTGLLCICQVRTLRMLEEEGNPWGAAMVVWKGSLSLSMPSVLKALCKALGAYERQTKAAVTSMVCMYSSRQWKADTNKFIFCSQIFLSSRCSNIHHLGPISWCFAPILSQSLQRYTGSPTVISLLPVCISFIFGSKKGIKNIHYSNGAWADLTGKHNYFS